MKIFYSWQMDAPRKVNKDFIYRALTQAIERLGNELDVSEAERDEIEVTQDTQGVLGSPEVVRIIFDRIASSNLIVSDVSLVARGRDGKKHINSNVAIELGYAYGQPGDEAVLKVMNAHYGTADDLPFDLRTRRHPVQYCLQPDAEKESIAAEQKRLTAELFRILKMYLGRPTTTHEENHLEALTHGKRSSFWGHDSPIVPKRHPYVHQDMYCSVPCLIYFRCIPQKAIARLSSREVEDATVELRPLLSDGGYSRARNRWGAVSYSISTEGEFVGFTQLFKNGEIWGVDATFGNRFTPFQDDDEEQKRFIPTGGVQREYPAAIDSFRKTAKMLGYGNKYTIEMGVSDASDLYLGMNREHLQRYPGPMYEKDVFLRQTVSPDQPTGEIMNAFWEKLFEEAGSEVPRQLIWQP